MNNIFKTHNDPVKIRAEKESGTEISPFDPPDEFAPPSLEPVSYNDFHPFLQQLIDEHIEFKNVLKAFEDALVKWKTNNWNFTNEINYGFKILFKYFDQNVPDHNQKEERKLFPPLHLKLIETGEHNTVDTSITGINLMEDEHIKAAQSVSIVLNFLALGSRLPDKESREITFHTAYEQGMALIETMNLHIFREENILFPQAMKYLSLNVLDSLLNT